MTIEVQPKSMRIRGGVVGLAFILLALVGCKSSLDAPVDPNRAQQAIEGALEAWKQGESPTALQQKSPPVYFNESEWKAGKSLVEYQIGPVSLHGRQGRCEVQLSLRDSAGKVTKRTIGYLIDTTPQVVITREGMGP